MEKKREQQEAGRKDAAAYKQVSSFTRCSRGIGLYELKGAQLSSPSRYGAYGGFHLPICATKLSHRVLTCFATELLRGAVYH